MDKCTLLLWVTILIISNIKLHLTFIQQYVRSQADVDHFVFSVETENNNFNRLFIASCLVRARSTYKDIRIRSFHHTHTHTHTYTRTHARTHAPPLPTHTRTHPASPTRTHTTLLVMGYGTSGRKKTTDQYAEEKRWVFSFDLKEPNEDECLTERGREFQITGQMY